VLARASSPQALLPPFGNAGQAPGADAQYGDRFLASDFIL
jgi:hypothetical protein